MPMDGELQLNIALPSYGLEGLKEKKTAKQRKIEFELRRADQLKKSFEREEKRRNEKKKVVEPAKTGQKQASKRKQEKKEEHGFASSVLRGEVMPTVHENEGKIVFPHLVLQTSGKVTGRRKDKTAKHKEKTGADQVSEGHADKHISKFPKKTKGVEDHVKKKNVSARGDDFASFVKKNESSKEPGKMASVGTSGKFLRKSRETREVSQEEFKFAFGDLAEKSNVIKNDVEITGEDDYQELIDKPKKKIPRGADNAERSRPRKQELSEEGSPRKSGKRRRDESDVEEGQRKAKRSKKAEDGEGGVAWRGKYTSLFGNNPEIPTVPRRAVRPVQEPIFSNEQFSGLPIHRFTVSNLSALGLTQLTTVQRKAVPVLLKGHDALVRSQTGSGKTLAYALPLVELLQRQRPPLTRADGVRALVVLPTRELALQTYECFLKLVKPFMRLVPGCLVGGEKRKSEKARLRRGITVLVGTPGRILDHVQHTRSLRLHRVQYLVLDEADRMLDLGYERDIASIVAELDSQSQPLLSKDVLEWNRKTSDQGNEEPTEDSIKKEKSKLRGYTSQDSGAEDEETSDEGASSMEEVKKKEEEEEVVVVDEIEVRRPRDEDETSDYDPEERADEVRDARELESEKWAEESDEEFEDEGRGTNENVWEVEEEESEGHEGGAEAKAEARERRRQTVLLSATLTPAVERLAGLALHVPIFVDAADADADSQDVVIPDSLVQCYMVVPAKLRLVTLSAFILWKCKFSQERKILLFCATQDMVDYLTELLTVGISRKDTDEQQDSDGEDDDPEDNFNVGVDFFRLHGHMEQKERTLVFQTFRAADCGVLLCTDVAARGLDLPRVDWIVQFTAPGSVPEYVHRVGRTARVGAAGSALLFLLPAEADFVQLLQDRRIRLQEEKMENCLKKLSQSSDSSQFRPNSPVEVAATALQLRYENAVLSRRSLHDSAIKGYTSFVRFYATYPKDVRDVFCFKALHLGHHAKSFALRDAPSAISGIGRRRFHKEQQRSGGRAPAGKQTKQSQQRREGARPRHGVGPPKAFRPHDRKRSRELLLSEFASGL